MALNSSRKLKFLVHTFEGTGHLNAVIGFCQALAEFGHECVFVVNESVIATVEKFGFRAIPLNQNSDSKPENDRAARFQAMGVSKHKSSLEKFRSFQSSQKETKSMEKMMNLMIEFNPQLEAIIEREQPIDAFILDHFLFPPAFGRDDIPWIMIGSASALIIYNTHELPPPCSGYPSNDKTDWEEFFEAYEDGVRYNDKFQEQLNQHFRYENNGHYERQGYFLRSPFLNIHQVPKELDYRNIYEPPSNVIAVDSFVRQEVDKLEGLPEEFRDAAWSGHKLVYLSMSSMGGSDIELMKRLTNILSRIPDIKAIVSKGPRGDEYELPVNCWGRNYLPQPTIVQMVDLVITHGGNNSVCETFSAGKPMIVMPLNVDQFDNAQRIHETGYGRRIEPYDFRDEDLATAIEEMLADEKLYEKGRAAKLRIQIEDTKGKAAKLVEEMLLNR